MRYLAPKSGVTLKTGLGFVHGHCKWHHLIDSIRVPIRLPFRRYSASNNGLTLKCGCGVVQGLGISAILFAPPNSLGTREFFFAYFFLAIVQVKRKGVSEIGVFRQISSFISRLYAIFNDREHISLSMRLVDKFRLTVGN